MLDGLKTGGGGIEVVGDLTVAEISTTSGFNTMMSALQTHRDIKVVLGGDTIVVGAYKALQGQRQAAPTTCSCPASTATGRRSS